MHSVRLLLCMICVAPSTGCLTSEPLRGRWMDRFNLLRNEPEPDTAFIEYVLIERPAQSDEINRTVWSRIDEQVLSYDTRSVLEDNGLRVGTAGATTSGPLRDMIERPRTDIGHRFKSFHPDRSTLLHLNSIPSADFDVRTETAKFRFQKPDTRMSFQISVRDAGNRRFTVRMVPHLTYREPLQYLVPGAGDDAPGGRDQATEELEGVVFEATIGPTEYLIIGTDYGRERTFGKSAFSVVTEGKPMQRILVLRAGKTKPERTSPPSLNGRDDKQESNVSPPIASQAGAVRAMRP